jgi:SAM-dependent methyltransferase
MAQGSPDGILDIAKVWARLLKYGSSTLAGIPARVQRGADLARIEGLRHEMAETVRRDPTSAAKYANHRFWIPFNACRIGYLSLHKSRPLRILDIGCGPGYFLAASRVCGHECYGIDAPAGVLTQTEQRVYGELLAALGCNGDVSPLLIERYVPMSLPQTGYDLISAFWICFNRHRQPDEWGVEEWRFFLDDALGHLRPGGTLHLELNANPDRYGNLQFYDQATLDYFRNIGSAERGVVRIRRDAPSR